jgi:hypothetical protein
VTDLDPVQHVLRRVDDRDGRDPGPPPRGLADDVLGWMRGNGPSGDERERGGGKEPRGGSLRLRSRDSC